MKKIVHSVVIGNWFPELCSVTIPLIKRWAQKIGADFNLISQTKYNSTPNYEKMQIWEIGKDYDWNIYLDADIIVNPDKMPDFTTGNPLAFHYEARLIDVRKCFLSHPHFLRDDRHFGVSDCFLVTSSFVHDLWHPPTMTIQEAANLCRIDKRMVSEAVISLNIARFRLQGIGTIGPDTNHFHLQTSDNINRPFNGGKAAMSKEAHLIRLYEKMRELSITP